MTDLTDDQTPEFIYGGPFVKRGRQDPLVDACTPRNVQLQCMFKRSFAFYTLSERLPIIITKVIDYMSRSKSEISKQCSSAGDADIKKAIQYCTKLKNDIVTNKRMDLLTENSEDAKQWNRWIEAQNQPYFFTSVWVFTECYVYRRLREAFELINNLKTFDPFLTQKQEAFQQNVQAMCSVSSRLNAMLQTDSNKENLVLLLKISLWANKCDLSLSLGAEVDQVVDPFDSIATFKSKLLVDDSNKIADFILEKSAALDKKIQEAPPLKAKCSCNRMAAARGLPTHEPPESEKNAEEPPPDGGRPCPSKTVTPPCVIFDIVCDNAGYELFTDLCIGHFLLAKGIVKKVRFHVKQIPWFVSDVTPQDFKFVIDACATSNFVKDLPQKEVTDESAEPPPPYVGDGSPLDKDPTKFITSKHLQTVGKECQKYVQDGSFVVEADGFWTTPHVYKDMKKYDEALYRKLQFAVFTLYKGDLNYRKLLGEVNWNPTKPFGEALQGFMPAPLAALRTVKADLICGLPAGKWDELTALDEKWMQKGDYGVIQLYPKKEDLKPTTMPCAEFGGTCKGNCS